MSIGQDMKEVFVEIGDPITILRTPTNITGEFVKLEINAQVTKPFIREFFIEATLAFDTQAVSGDWIQLADGRVLMVMNKTPKLLEGDIMQFSCVLYKCNVTGVVLRPTYTRSGPNRETVWSVVKENVPALITEAMYGNALDVDEPVGQVSMTEHDLYIPTSVGLGVKDRFKIPDLRCFQVEVVRNFRFDRVDLATVGEDTRGQDSYVFT